MIVTLCDVPHFVLQITNQYTFRSLFTKENKWSTCTMQQIKMAFFDEKSVYALISI